MHHAGHQSQGAAGILHVGLLAADGRAYVQRVLRQRNRARESIDAGRIGLAGAGDVERDVASDADGVSRAIDGVDSVLVDGGGLPHAGHIEGKDGGGRGGQRHGNGRGELPLVERHNLHAGAGDGEGNQGGHLVGRCIDQGSGCAVEEHGGPRQTPGDHAVGI